MKPWNEKSLAGQLLKGRYPRSARGNVHSQTGQMMIWDEGVKDL